MNKNTLYNISNSKININFENKYNKNTYFKLLNSPLKQSSNSKSINEIFETFNFVHIYSLPFYTNGESSIKDLIEIGNIRKCNKNVLFPTFYFDFSNTTRISIIELYKTIIISYAINSIKVFKFIGQAENHCGQYFIIKSSNYVQGSIIHLFLTDNEIDNKKAIKLENLFNSHLEFCQNSYFFGDYFPSYIHQELAKEIYYDMNLLCKTSFEITKLFESNKWKPSSCIKFKRYLKTQNILNTNINFNQNKNLKNNLDDNQNKILKNNLDDNQNKNHNFSCFCFENSTIILCQLIRLFINTLAKLTPFFEIEQIKLSINNVFKTLYKIYKNKYCKNIVINVYSPNLTNLAVNLMYTHLSLKKSIKYVKFGDNWNCQLSYLPKEQFFKNESCFNITNSLDLVLYQPYNIINVLKKIKTLNYKKVKFVSINENLRILKNSLLYNKKKKINAGELVTLINYTNNNQVCIKKGDIIGDVSQNILTLEINKTSFDDPLLKYQKLSSCSYKIVSKAQKGKIITIRDEDGLDFNYKFHISQPMICKNKYLFPPYLKIRRIKTKKKIVKSYFSNCVEYLFNNVQTFKNLIFQRFLNTSSIQNQTPIIVKPKIQQKFILCTLETFNNRAATIITTLTN